MTDENTTLRELEERYLSDEAVEQFDALMHESQLRMRRRVRRFALQAVGMAAVIALVCLVVPAGRQPDVQPEITTAELIDPIRVLMDLGIEDLRITADPAQRGVLVEAGTEDGESAFYLMQCGDDGSTIRLTAL